MVMKQLDLGSIASYYGYNNDSIIIILNTGLR